MGKWAQGLDRDETMQRDTHDHEDSGRTAIEEATEQLEDGAYLDPKIQAQLGRVFRSYCDDLLHQPIPDKFTVLLARLEAKQRGQK